MTTVEADELDAEAEKCGEILVGSSGKFTFVCVLCARSFMTLRSFGAHINSQHIKVDAESHITDLSPLGVNTIVEESHSPSNEEQIEINLSTSSQNRIPPQIAEYEDDCESDSDQTEEPPTEDRISGSRHQCQTIDEAEMANTTVTNQVTSRPVPSTQTMTCKYCDKHFVDTTTFGEHLSTHAGPKKFGCGFCSKTFNRRQNRQQHILTHTGERPHKCSYCPKTFANRTNMIKHESIHLGIKKYSCTYCDKSFVASSDKKLHEMTHTGEKPHQCAECGKQYVRAYLLDEHMRSHTNTRDYKCDVCGMAFFTVKLLRRHNIVHTKERPYRCKVCDQDFPRPKALRTHMQLHSNEKSYVCPVCGKAFAQYAGLYSHKKSHVLKPV